MNRKTLLTLLMLTISTVGMAQSRGQFSAGINARYGTDVRGMGLGAKLQYGITDAWRVEGGYGRFFKKDGMVRQDFSLHVHYLLPPAGLFQLYPIAGLGVATAKYDGLSKHFENGQEKAVERETKVGADLGAGVDLTITPYFSVSLQCYYQIVKSYNQCVFSIGTLYRF